MDLKELETSSSPEHVWSSFLAHNTAKELSLPMLSKILETAESNGSLENLASDLVQLFFKDLHKAFVFFETSVEFITSVLVLSTTKGSDTTERSLVLELISDISREIVASSSTDVNAPQRMQLLLLSASRSRLPLLCWVPILRAFVTGLLTSPADTELLEAVSMQVTWRQQDGDTSWRGFFLELLRSQVLETAQLLELIEQQIFGEAAAVNLRLLLSFVASATFTRQGAAASLRALVRDKLPAELDSGRLEKAGRALLVVRELGLEAAARQPHFAALSYADWWQCGPAAGLSAPSLKAFRALYRMLWDWLPHEAEPLLLRPQLQHPALPSRELRSPGTAQDARAYQDAARSRLAEIRASNTS